MPELPDVETFRRYLGSTGLHRRVETVSVRAPQVLLVAESTLRRHLLGNELTSTRRRGKQLFAAISDGYWLTLHFGMTGLLRAFRGSERETEHDRVVLIFADDDRLVFRCQRMFGRVGITRDPDEFIERHRLGPDALETGPGELAERLAGRRGKIKTTLMNQEVIAGIGNVYSDEILFHARVHPDREIPSLEGPELEAVCRLTGEVLRAAIEVKANPERMPPSWITPRRNEGGAECPRCGGELATHPAGQRTAVICPRCQPG